MILYIDTKDQKLVKISLKKGKEILESLSEENEYGSQVLLPMILKLLQASTPGVSIQFHPGGGGVNWKIIKGIEVEIGPGSFTGLRVGISVANALGYSLKIPVNGKKIEDQINY